MIRRVLYFLLILVGSAYTSSGQQFAYQLWHEGKMVLDTGDTLRGQLKYDLQNDILQYQVNKKLESFTARKVLFFEIFDNTVKQYRTFYSLPYSSGGGDYKAPVFFELIDEGKLTVLCREALEYRTYSTGFYSYGSYQRLILVNKYYILKESGIIEEFKGGKNDWYDLMKNKADDVKDFAKKNKYSLDEKQELAKVIDYYNSFFR